MASRQQQRGTGYGIQYDDIVPKSEWKDQPEATILTIELPGFAKEQIKVTYVHTSKVIRVTGERQVTDRRWSRFNEVFSVPQNCLVDKIHGGFRNNVLTLTMPKETITKTAHHPEASRTVAEKVEKLEAEKRLLEETRRKEREEEAEKKRNKLLEEKEELLKKLQEETKAKEMAEERKLNEEIKAKKMAQERKLQEEAKAKKIAEERKLQEEAKERKLEEEAKLKEKAEERKLAEEATLEKKIKESKLVDESGKPEERKLPEVVYTKSGLEPGTKSAAMSKAKSAAVSGAKSVSKGVGEVVKSAEDKLGYLVGKEKKMGKGIMEKIRGKEITSEDKKLMVNVGVAALVIFALGAYVSYTFCSSSSSSSSSSSPSSSSSSTKPQ